LLTEHKVHLWSVWSLAVLLFVPGGRVYAAQQEHPQRPAGSKSTKGGHEAQHPKPGRGQPPPNLFQRLRELPPQEQERLMASEQFRRLPRQRQQQIRQNLARWNAMTPEQKDTFRQREEIFEGLSPSQRDELRSVFPRWRALPPERQQQLMQGFRQLRDMTPDERQGFLSSPQAVKQFTPEERDILGSLNRLLPGSEGAAPATETAPDQ
jgi:hypothetical protein